MRMVVIEYSNGEIACKSMIWDIKYYEERYNILTVVNKLRSPYYVKRIRAYYKGIPMSERKYLSRLIEGDMITKAVFIAEVEGLGYEVIEGFLEEEGKEMVDVLFICKDNKPVANVGLDKMYVFRNDYLAFEELTEVEKRKLMPLLLKYIMTETNYR